MKTKLLTIFAVLFTIIMNAQTTGDPTGGVDILQYVQSMAAMLVLIPIIVEFANMVLKIHGLGLQILSWVIGIAISIVAQLLDLGIFADLVLWQAAVVGLGASLAANGVADLGFIQSILKLIGINTDKK
jgi:hypothetical protein